MDEIDDVLARIQDQEEHLALVQDQVNRLEVTGLAGRGEVTARVRGTGELVEVVIDPWLLRGDVATVEALVVEAVNDALHRRTAEIERRFAPLLDPAR